MMMRLVLLLALALSTQAVFFRGSADKKSEKSASSRILQTYYSCSFLALYYGPNVDPASYGCGEDKTEGCTIYEELLQTVDEVRCSSNALCSDKWHMGVGGICVKTTEGNKEVLKCVREGTEAAESAEAFLCG